MAQTQKRLFATSSLTLALLIILTIGVEAHSQEDKVTTDEANTESATTESAATNEEMVELRRYLGDWVSDKRKDPNDREFQFNYKLEWFDRRESLIKMTIRQEYSDGETLLLWEGFKGWHPVKNVVYYHGFSPSGRSGAGTLRKDGNLLHTEYEGYDAGGNGVELRDTFTSLAPDSFRSETNILRAGKWQTVNVETWHRRK